MTLIRNKITHRQGIFSIQSNSVITNSTGPSLFVRYNRDVVVTVKLYVVKSPFGTQNLICYSREFVITVIVIVEFDCILSFQDYFIDKKTTSKSKIIAEERETVTSTTMQASTDGICNHSKIQGCFGSLLNHLEKVW
jgi:hypothetical protein